MPIIISCLGKTNTRKFLVALPNFIPDKYGRELCLFKEVAIGFAGNLKNEGFSVFLLFTLYFFLFCFACKTYS